MNWLIENSFWILIGVAFVVMHLFCHGSHGSHGSHGGHGGHGGHGAHGSGKPDADDPPNRNTDEGHRH